MNPFTHYALIGSIVASAIGGIVLCVLVIRYGFQVPFEESSSEASQRIFATRLAHAVAATCFAITALLTVVALSPRSSERSGREAEAGRLAEELRALDARVSRVEELVREVGKSVDALLRRVDAAEAPSAPLPPRPSGSR